MRAIGFHKRQSLYIDFFPEESLSEVFSEKFQRVEGLESHEVYRGGGFRDEGVGGAEPGEGARGAVGQVVATDLVRGLALIGPRKATANLEFGDHWVLPACAPLP